MYLGCEAAEKGWASVQNHEDGKRVLSDGVEEELLEAEGNTRARTYKLKDFIEESFTIKASQGDDEGAVWRFRILPLIENSPIEVPENVVNICQYGFTEMLNNVFDHSASPNCILSYEQNAKRIRILVIDHGIGVFQRIQNDFGLDDARSALLELSKGKLTSQPRRHSGEGIFFTSRMFERFSIGSEDLYYARTKYDDEEWLIESGDSEEKVKGTIVRLEIPLNAEWTTRDVFKQFESDDMRFRHTHIPIKLALYPNEQLISRSQAKRLLTRFDEFGEVLLDFQGIEEVGRAFIDEIFRVYRLDHPEIELLWLRANSDITQLILNAMEAIDEPPQ